MIPQPGGANSSYLPYPASGSNFPPYPTSNFGGFPSYPGASSSSNPPSSGGYPPYMPQNPSIPTGGYNNFYGGVSSNSIGSIKLYEDSVLMAFDFKSFSKRTHHKMEQ